MEIRTWSAVTHIDAARWDALVGDAPPFVEHAFLASLEEAGCVGDDSGWLPVLLTAHDDGDDRPIGAAPAYIKTHSMGEFVYDWSWAEAASRHGLSYYPKLVLAAPFSPVPGRRLLTAPDLSDARRRDVQRALLSGAVEVAHQAGCSGVHVLFCTDEERAVAEELGFFHRLGTQLHWENAGYDTFDDFLARFKSKRRNQMRRERRKVAEAGITVDNHLGDEVEDGWSELAFELYCSTVDKFLWGRRYLNERFFELLWERMRSRLQLVLAHKDGAVVAGAINLEKAGRRHGRYWGTFEDHDCLHFEVCAYASIEDCIARGVQAFEAGAGGYGHKYGRGFLPVYTHSVHLMFHRRFGEALADFCEREARAVRREAEELREGLFVR